MRPESHYYVDYEEKAKNILARILQMESFVLPPFSAFVGNGYVQHAGAEYHSHSNICYHVYLVSKYIKLPDAIEFSYGGSFATNN